MAAAPPRRPAGAAAGVDTGACLSMHQPWASLLVWGIKRIEGRGWPTEHRGRLWIAATAKQPTPQEIEEMEEFYRSVHGSTPLDFPPAYPTGVLLGCVEVVGCLKAEQVEGWEALPEGLRSEVGSPFCFLCQGPQRLVVPHPMRGWPKIFQLEKKLHKVAQLGLKPAPNGKGFDWGACGQPPADDSGLAPSKSKQKFRELQQRMEAGRKDSSGAGGTGSSGGSGGYDPDQGGGRAAKTQACQSPRAAAAAAALGGVPRTVALQQRRKQQAEQAQQAAQQAQQAAQQAQQLDPAKRARAVEKKLRQIAALEELQQGGQALRAEEAAKLEQRAALEEELAQLRLGTGS